VDTLSHKITAMAHGTSVEVVTET